MIALAIVLVLEGGVVAPPPGTGTDLDARAPTSPSDWLEWVAPPECPDRDRVLALVARLVPSTPPMRLRARAALEIEDDVATLRLALERDGYIDGRTLVADTCDAVARAAALLLAVAIDPVTTAMTVTAIAPTPEATATSTKTPRDERSPPVTEAPPAEPIPEPRDRPRPVPRARHARPTPPAFTLAAGGVGELGALPSGGLGAAVVLGLAWPRIRAEVLGHASWSPRAIETRSGLSARTSQGTAAARVCARLLSSASVIELPLCGGFEAGASTLDSRTPERARDERGPWAAAIASMGLVWPPNAIAALRIEAGLAVPIYRTAYRVGDERLARPTGVTGRGTVLLELRFGGPRSSPRNSMRVEMNGS